MASLVKGLRLLASRRMNLSKLQNKAETLKSFSTSRVRNSQEWQQEGIPGANLPFDISSSGKLTLHFIIFFTVSLTAPFLIMRHSLLLANAKDDDGGYLEFQETTLTICKDVAGEPVESGETAVTKDSQ